MRNEEAVKRHFCLSCVAHSLLHKAVSSGGKSEKFNFTQSGQSLGQKRHTLTREALGKVVHLVQKLLAQGQTLEQVLEVLMPA